MIGRAVKIAQSAEGEREQIGAFIADDVTRELISRVAAERGWSTAGIQGGGVSAAARALAIVDPPKVLVIDVSDCDDAVADVRALTGMLEQETMVVVIGIVNDVGLYRRMLTIGAVDYLVKPATLDAVREALSRTETQLHQSARSGGRTLLFLGTRGGVGSTTLATSCAWTTANGFGRQTVLVDLDLQLGTVALSLDLEPGAGLRDALTDPDRVDEVFLERAIVKSGEKLAVLGSEEPLDDAPVFDAGAARHLFGALAASYDFTFVDLPTRLAVVQPDLLSLAHEIVLVTDLSLPGLRDLNRLRRFVRATGVDVPVSIVANLVGANRRGQLSQSEFEKGLEGKLDHVIPYDQKAAAKTANIGTPLATEPRSSAMAPITALASALTGIKPAKRSLWRKRAR